MACENTTCSPAFQLTHMPAFTASKPPKPKRTAPRPAAAKDHSGNSVGARTTVPRLIRIAELIRQGKCPPKEQVALLFETSTRTIERDFEFLRTQCCMEFVFDRAKNVHRATTPTVGLPAMQMTIPEIMSLVIGRRAVQSHSGAGLFELATAAIAKITTFMTDDQAEEWRQMDALISYTGTPSLGRIDATIFPTLAQAMWDCGEIELYYRKPEAEEPEWRRVRPLHLFFRNNRWYLWAQDHARGFKGRRFALSRIRQVRRHEERFTRPAGFDPEKVIADTVGLYGGGEPERIRLRLDLVAAGWFDESPLHASQQITRQSDGTYELTAEIAITPELEGIILRWGIKIEVLEPKRLKDAVLETARAIVARG